MKKKNRLIHWLKMWNPKWILNPFYSPSYATYAIGATIINGIAKGIKSNEPFTGFSPKTWEVIERSANTITFGYEECNDE